MLAEVYHHDDAQLKHRARGVLQRSLAVGGRW
jgi:hypothetical protein